MIEKRVAVPIGLLAAFFSFGAFAQNSPARIHTKLFVGVTPERNAGYITTGPSMNRGRAVPIGFSFDDSAFPDRTEFVELYLGLTANKNAGIVSINPRFRGGASTAVGVISRQPIQDGIKLYVVTSCVVENNAGVPHDRNLTGVITNTVSFNRCSTRTLGYIAKVR